jgi:adenylate cyclase
VPRPAGTLSVRSGCRMWLPSAPRVCHRQRVTDQWDMPAAGPATTRASEFDPFARWAPYGDFDDEDPLIPGTERPEFLPPTDGPIELERTFAFVDICGFTAFTEEQGPRRSLQMLKIFRSLIKEIAGRRGIRVAKWLGDGALLVGVLPGPTVATIAELTGRFETLSIDLRAGVASGVALLFDGDDYIGRPVNLAARLCDEAGPGELLADNDSLRGQPDWVQAGRSRVVEVRGVGEVEVRPLRPAFDVQFPPEPADEL